jgi:hypothetical protein
MKMTCERKELCAFLTAQLASTGTHWSMGTFGAIAEFARGKEELGCIVADGEGLSAVTARGALALQVPSATRAIAFEVTTKTDWSQRVALCLPEEMAAMNGRRVLTELGPDRSAMREQDRGSLLFDLGFGAPHIDCCIRIADNELAEKLREYCGSPIFDTEAVEIILDASPHRVFLSPLGRVEVYQPIPPHGGKSPNGPHTHVLPALLRHRRTHPATEPIPPGMVPCAYVYPPHPTKDRLGRHRKFDRSRYECFQAILHKYGNPTFYELKKRVFDAVFAGAEPSAIVVPDLRFARTNVRVALRQLQVQHELSQVPIASSCLSAWLSVHECGRRGHAPAS